jgi:hypothetical protein
VERLRDAMPALFTKSDPIKEPLDRKVTRPEMDGLFGAETVAVSVTLEP